MKSMHKGHPKWKGEVIQNQPVAAKVNSYCCGNIDPKADKRKEGGHKSQTLVHTVFFAHLP